MEILVIVEPVSLQSDALPLVCQGRQKPASTRRAAVKESDGLIQRCGPERLEPVETTPGSSLNQRRDRLHVAVVILDYGHAQICFVMKGART
jgi:hypothetical protein